MSTLYHENASHLNSSDTLAAKASNFLAPIARILLAVIFVVAGISKIGAYAQTAAWMGAMGVPGILLPLVILLETAGGIALALGWHTRLAAFLLAGFSLLSAFIFHNNFADQIQMLMFMKNLAIAGGLLLLVSQGAGAYSLDATLNKHRI